MSKPVERVEIITGRERRRRYTTQEKVRLRVAARAAKPGDADASLPTSEWCAKVQPSGVWHEPQPQPQAQAQAQAHNKICACAFSACEEWLYAAYMLHDFWSA